MPNRTSHSLYVVASSLLAFTLIAGCAKKDTATTDTTVTTTPAVTPTPVPTITDAQIAAIVVAANTTDIDAAKQALDKTKDAKIKTFANSMVADHSALNKQATDLVTKLGVTPESNPTSMSLTDGGKASMAALAGKSGAEFDKAYIDNEVTYHQTVLDAIDRTLIPGAQNAELKALLEAARPTVASHLEHAKTVQGGMTKM